MMKHQITKGFIRIIFILGALLGLASAMLSYAVVAQDGGVSGFDRAMGDLQPSSTSGQAAFQQLGAGGSGSAASSSFDPNAFTQQFSQSASPTSNLKIKEFYPDKNSFVLSCDLADQGFHPTTFSWYFGDGQKLLDVQNSNVYHTYASSGNYPASCTASDGATSRSASLNVSAFNAQQIAQMSNQTSGQGSAIGASGGGSSAAIAGSGVQGVVVQGGNIASNPFVSQFSANNNPRVAAYYPQNNGYLFNCNLANGGFQPIQYTWNFGDGTMYNSTRANNAMHQYMQGGNYTIACLGTDGINTRISRIKVSVDTLDRTNNPYAAYYYGASGVPPPVSPSYAGYGAAPYSGLQYGVGGAIGGGAIGAAIGGYPVGYGGGYPAGYAGGYPSSYAGGYPAAYPGGYPGVVGSPGIVGSPGVISSPGVIGSPGVASYPAYSPAIAYNGAYGGAGYGSGYTGMPAVLGVGNALYPGAGVGAGGYGSGYGYAPGASYGGYAGAYAPVAQNPYAQYAQPYAQSYPQYSSYPQYPQYSQPGSGDIYSMQQNGAMPAVQGTVPQGATQQGGGAATAAASAAQSSVAPSSPSSDAGQSASVNSSLGSDSSVSGGSSPSNDAAQSTQGVQGGVGTAGGSGTASGAISASDVGASSSSTGAATGTSTVAINSYGFQPRAVQISPGTTVIWQNKDSVEHTVTSLNQTFDSGLLFGGESYSFTFNKPGSYYYKDALHPQAIGTVTVSGG
jgi:plastocyanin